MLKQLNTPACLPVIAATLATSGSLVAQDRGHGHDHARPARPVAGTGTTSAAPASEPHLLGTDPVAGEDPGLLASQVTARHEGRELRVASEKHAEAFLGNRLFRLCRKGCKKPLRQDPLKHLAMPDEAVRDSRNGGEVEAGQGGHGDQRGHGGGH